MVRNIHILEVGWLSGLGKIVRSVFVRILPVVLVVSSNAFIPFWRSSLAMAHF